MRRRSRRERDAAAANTARARRGGRNEDRPIRVVVAQAPAGPPDLIARFVAEPLARSLGVPVVAENRPGASGIIGVEQLRAQHPTAARC